MPNNQVLINGVLITPKAFEIASIFLPIPHHLECTTLHDEVLVKVQKALNNN